MQGKILRILNAGARISRPGKGDDMNDRIIDVEIQLMHHENTIQQLNEVIAAQQIAIDKMQTDIKRIMEHLRTISPSLVRDASDEEPPPHY